MKKTRQIFSAKQQEYVVCASGRALININGQEVKTSSQVPVSINDGREMAYEVREETLYEYDTFWIDNINGNTKEAVLQAIKSKIVDEIADYDSSTRVNGFKLNGTKVWLDKATRVGLMNSTNIAKASGSKTTSLWLGNAMYDLDCDKVIKILSKLEMYALECFNVTASHKQEVSELSDITDLLNYDYTTGYPKQLEISIL